MTYDTNNSLGDLFSFPEPSRNRPEYRDPVARAEQQARAKALSTENLKRQLLVNKPDSVEYLFIWEELGRRGVDSFKLVPVVERLKMWATWPEVWAISAVAVGGIWWWMHRSKSAAVAGVDSSGLSEWHMEEKPKRKKRRKSRRKSKK